MALGDDKFSKPEGKFYRDKNGSLREREEIEVPEGKFFDKQLIYLWFAGK